MIPIPYPFPYCKGCSYLNDEIQVQYGNNRVTLPFCDFYELHFVSVRRIEKCSDTCLHYDEGNI